MARILYDPLKVNVKCGADISYQHKQSTNGLKVYKTTSRNRGVVKIINIEMVPGFPNRHGSEIDVTNLTSLFTQIGFIVDVHPLTVTSHTKWGIEKCLHEFVSDQRLKTADIAILIIMSHGTRKHNQDVFYSIDGEPIFCDNVKRYFTNRYCKHMLHKPKIIIFQMCRGQNIDDGNAVVFNELQCDGHSNILDKVPTTTDLLVVHSTLPDFVTFRYTQTGSMFINMLCEVFMEQAYKYDVVTMLNNIFRKMARTDIDNNGRRIFSTGEFTSTVFGLCFLNPGVYLDDSGILRSISTSECHTPKSNLHVVASNGDWKDCVKLIEEGADVNALNEKGSTPLHCAASHGHWECCIKLLEAGALVDARDSSRQTPLHYAATSGHWKVCQTLVDGGSDVNKPNGDGCTPLDCAIINGKTTCEMLLVQAGGISNHVKVRNSLWDDSMDWEMC